MTQSTDSLDVKDLKDVAAGGLVREDVLDKIFDISPYETPFLDAVGQGTFDNNYSEWTEDQLASPDIDNAVSSGTDAEGATAATGARVGNHAQISRKVVNVTDRAVAVNNIGTSDILGRVTERKLQELRHDVEAVALSPQASIADNPGTTIGRTAGFDAWLTTNVDIDSGGLLGGFNSSTKVVDAPAPGSARALTWKMISDQIEACYLVGAKPSILMSRPEITKRLNQYLVTTSRQASLVANVNGTATQEMVSNQFVDVVKTDFGYTMNIVPNRTQQTYEGDDPSFENATLFGIDPMFVEVAYLYGYKVEPLAKNGDYVRRLLQVDWMVKVLLERAHFGIRDLQLTAEVESGYGA